MCCLSTCLDSGDDTACSLTSHVLLRVRDPRGSSEPFLLAVVQPHIIISIAPNETPHFRINSLLPSRILGEREPHSWTD